MPKPEKLASSSGIEGGDNRIVRCRYRCLGSNPHEFGKILRIADLDNVQCDVHPDAAIKRLNRLPRERAEFNEDLRSMGLRAAKWTIAQGMPEGYGPGESIDPTELQPWESDND